jgi:hypothetical protein
MAEVDLTLIANNQQYINALKQAQGAEQEFHYILRRNYKEQEGIINSTIHAIQKYEEQKKKAWTTQDIERYNKRIEEAKNALNEYNKIGVKVQNEQSKMWNNVKDFVTKAAAALVAYHTIVKVGEKIIGSTEALHHQWEVALKQVETAINFVGKSIASLDFSNFIDGMKNAIAAGKQYVEIQEQLQNRTNSLNIATIDERKRFEELQTIMRSIGEEDSVRLSAANEAKVLELSMMDRKKKLLIDTYQNEINLLMATLPGKRKYSETEKSNLEYLIKNYDFMLPVIEKAEEYNNKLATRSLYIAKENEGNRATQGSYSAAIVTTKNYSDEIDKLNEEINNTDQSTKFWASTLKKFGLTNREERLRITQLYSAIGQAELDAIQKTKRANIMISGLEEEIQNKKDKAAKEARDRELKRQEEFQRLSEELYKRYNESIAKSYTEREAILASEQWQLKEVDSLRNRMIVIGNLTWEQESEISNLKRNIHKETLDKLKVIDDKELKQKKESNKKMLDLSETLETEISELNEEGEVARLRIQIKYAGERIKILNKENTQESQIEAIQLQNFIGAARDKIDKIEKFDIYKLFGVDTSTELGKEQQSLIDNAASQIVNAIETVRDAEIEAAEERRSELDSRVDDLESAVDKEKELNEKGLANNLDATRRELFLTKQERLKAWNEEKKLKQQQIRADTALQTSKLILSATDLFQSQASKGIVGVVIAAGLIASMYGIIASARARAKSLQAEEDNLKLAKGAYGDTTGIINGKSHSQGGENFLNHIEVEKGERWAVFNQSATRKFQNILPEWVKTINSGKWPNYEINSSITNPISLKTDHLHKELTSINKGINKLNDNFETIKTYQIGKKRIEQRKNHIRVINNAV